MVFYSSGGLSCEDSLRSVPGPASVGATGSFGGGRTRGVGGGGTQGRTPR